MLPQINWVTPARRHFCGVCKEVFVCHICKIDWQHPLHDHCRIYLCLECFKKKHQTHVAITTTRKRYDYVTGKLIRSF